MVPPFKKIYIPNSRKRSANRPDRHNLYIYAPIIQALPPCLSVGWCAVKGLVPYALFIGYEIIKS